MQPLRRSTQKKGVQRTAETAFSKCDEAPALCCCCRRRRAPPPLLRFVCKRIAPFYLLRSCSPCAHPKSVRVRYPHTLCPCQASREIPLASSLAVGKWQERGTPPPPRRWLCPRILGAPCAPCPPRAAAPSLCLSSCSEGQRAEQVRTMLGAAPKDRCPKTAPLRAGGPLPPAWRTKRRTALPFLVCVGFAAAFCLLCMTLYDFALKSFTRRATNAINSSYLNQYFR